MVDYARMNQSLYEGNAAAVEQMTKDALADGRAVQEVLNEGLIAGMSVVGEDFKLMGLVTTGTLLFFRRKGWIGNKEADLPEDKPAKKPTEPAR